MSPTFSNQHIPYGHPINFWEFFGYLFLGESFFVKQPHFSYFLVIKLCVRIFNAFKGSPFVSAISHVVHIGSNKHVIRINARRLIAIMADKQSFGYWPHEHYPRKATPSVCPSLENTPRIPFWIKRLFPNPARGFVTSVLNGILLVPICFYIFQRFWFWT